jgi:hypothetical protein
MYHVKGFFPFPLIFISLLLTFLTSLSLRKSPKSQSITLTVTSSTLHLPGATRSYPSLSEPRKQTPCFLRPCHGPTLFLLASVARVWCPVLAPAVCVRSIRYSIQHLALVLIILQAPQLLPEPPSLLSKL